VRWRLQSTGSVLKSSRLHSPQGKILDFLIRCPAAVIMAVMIMISTFGCCNGRILEGACVYCAMAKDELFFEVRGKLNRKSASGIARAVQTV